MIDAKDLRIGNWINLGLRQDLPIYGKVLSIGSLEQEFEQIYCECEESFEWAFKDNYTGIPITPEILEKCGFSVTRTTAHPNNIWTLKHEEGVFELEEIKSFFLCSSQYEVEIKYLHELQNLYYALTKQELEYKP